MTTNRYAQECKNCGEVVLPGKGILTQEWDNQADDMVWVVRHADNNVCQTIARINAEDAQRREIVQAIIAYIKEYGELVETTDGPEIIYDGRRGYNQVGWLITRDTTNTIYMTSRCSSDGWSMSETYMLTDSTDEDEGFGNSNSDIARILAGGVGDAKAFEI